MRSGAFDNLPGRGKPLKLINNPYAPGTELAYQLLKDNEYTLPWISERVGLLTRIDALRQDIRTSWLALQAEYHSAEEDSLRQVLAQGWQDQLSSWSDQIAKLNKEITGLNLKQPGVQLEILKLTLATELSRVGAVPHLG